MHLSKFFLLLLLPLLFACTSQRIINNNYLINAIDTSGNTLLNLADPVIQKNDLLSIKVYSQGGGVDPKVDAPYNLPEQTVSGSSTTSTSAGFLVTTSGDIEYPQLGVLHVEGLKKAEVAQIIRARLDSVLKKPTVIIRFLNYRITVLGEVRTPGAFTIPTERITILEALGLAGDITDYGNKNTVKILREKDGKLNTAIVDLTSKDFFSSPYFRLQQNDVVIVEQTRRKIQQQERQDVLQQIGIVTSVVTAVALVLNFIR